MISCGSKGDPFAVVMNTVDADDITCLFIFINNTLTNAVAYVSGACEDKLCF